MKEDKGREVEKGRKKRKRSSSLLPDEEKGKKVEKGRRKKRKGASSSVKQQTSGPIIDWAEELPWKDATPSDPAALLFGSQEGGFICLEELEPSCSLKLPQSLPNPGTKQGLEEEEEEEEEEDDDNDDDEGGMEVVDNSLLSQPKVVIPSIDDTQQDQVKKIQKKKRKMPTRTKKSDQKKAQQETENPIMDWIIGQDDSFSCYQSFEHPKDAISLSETFANDQIEPKANDLSAWNDLRLHLKIQKALSVLGFAQPTPIQKACIPAAAHKGKDVIGAAETGSGKTLCYVIPILQRLLEEDDKISMSENFDKLPEMADKRASNEGSPLRALIITPTRELALQVCNHFRAAAMYTRFKVVPIVGGMATQKQQRLLKKRPQAVVGTPGRLWELMNVGESHLLELHALSFLVLDEADRMVEKGHFKELHSIIDTLPRNQHDLQVRKENVSERQSYTAEADSICNVKDGSNSTKSISVNGAKRWKRRQTFVFSATLALPPGFRRKLKNGFQGLSSAGATGEYSVATLSERAGVHHNGAIVDLTTKNIIATKVDESVIECAEDQKDFFLYYILKLHGCGRTIVFCTSIACVRRVSAVLKTLQISVWPLHAQMQQKQRLKAMDRFRTNQDGVLIATDVAARGLDIVGVRTVIHYQLPHSAEVYVHRSGRTARASSDGCSIALISPPDKRNYSVLCRALSKENGLSPFPIRMEYMLAIEKRVHLACDIDQLLHNNSQLKAKSSWLKRNAEALEIDIDGDMIDDKENDLINERNLKNSQLFKIRKMQKELHHLLEQPLEPRSLSRRFITGAGLSSFVARQLQEYVSSKNSKHFKKKSSKVAMANGIGENRTRLVVIGQETMEPLMAIKARGL